MRADNKGARKDQTADNLRVLTTLCNLPTAPYREQHVIAWLLDFAQSLGPAVRVRRDGVGNVYLEYRRGKSRGRPLVIEAHMDHPGFVLTGRSRGGELRAEFRGGVRPSCFAGARVRFWDEAAGGRWLRTRVLAVKQTRGKRTLRATLAGVREKLPVGAIGMWDLPDAQVKSGIFAARVCDDLGGVAALLCLLSELAAQNVEGHVIGLCSRAEEVGFAGVLAVCENGWLPRGSSVIGLETSKASAGSPQGAGPIIRVGDRTGIFSPGLTYFLSQTAGHLADDDAAFKYQRKLMDGGTCNSTAFLAYGYDSAALCLALGNYHNMAVKGEVGWGDGAKAGKAIASETIHTRDFLGLVRLLVETVKRFAGYEPGLGAFRGRLSKMHREEQRGLFRANPV